MSKRLATCGSGERSATASRTTIVRNPLEHASTAVARMQPLVLAPAISTVSTRWATSRLARSVPKKRRGVFLPHDHVVLAAAQPLVELDPLPALLHAVVGDLALPHAGVA